MRGVSKRLGTGIAIAASLCLGSITEGRAAEPFPTRPIEVIVPGPAGGGTDIMTRVLAEAVGSILGQKLVIVNKSGGGGAVGAQLLASARPDGYTVGALPNGPVTMATHILDLGYSINDLVPLTQITAAPVVLCSRSDFPASDAKELVAYARQHPGKVTYASDGLGGSADFPIRRLMQALDIPMRMVPQGGAGESLKALLGGHVDLYAGSVSPVVPHVESGKVRCLMVTTESRNEKIPEAMSASDLGVRGAATALWRGIFAPKGVPSDRLAILEKAFREGARTESVRSHLRKLGEDIVAGSGEDLARVMHAESEAFARIAKELNLKKQ